MSVKKEARYSWSPEMERAYTDGYADAQEANKTERDFMRKVIAEIEWLCDGREDIDNNGGPNLAMQIMTAIRGLKP